MRVVYYYRRTLLDTPEGAARHQQTCNLLSQLRAEGRITKCVTQDADAGFPTEEARHQLFNQLRDFAGRHKVGLADVFGSNRRSFWYLPPQFLLVFEGDALREVFPCRIGDEEVEPLEYLEQVAAGRPWTIRSIKGMEGKKHTALVAQILVKPDILEAGLVLQGRNVQVSRNFGELGFVDLVFNDRDGRPLLVEVKVGPEELDKAIGQILRHRQLFAQQNRLEDGTVRVGIACPYIPPQYRSICERVGITCFEIPSS